MTRTRVGVVVPIEKRRTVGDGSRQRLAERGLADFGEGDEHPEHPVTRDDAVDEELDTGLGDALPFGDDDGGVMEEGGVEAARRCARVRSILDAL